MNDYSLVRFAVMGAAALLAWFGVKRVDQIKFWVLLSSFILAQLLLSFNKFYSHTSPADPGNVLLVFIRDILIFSCIFRLYFRFKAQDKNPFLPIAGFAAFALLLIFPTWSISSAHTHWRHHEIAKDYLENLDDQIKSRTCVSEFNFPNRYDCLGFVQTKRPDLAGAALEIGCNQGIDDMCTELLQFSGPRDETLELAQTRLIDKYDQLCETAPEEAVNCLQWARGITAQPGTFLDIEAFYSRMEPICFEEEGGDAYASCDMIVKYYTGTAAYAPEFREDAENKTALYERAKAAGEQWYEAQNIKNEFPNFGKLPQFAWERAVNYTDLLYYYSHDYSDVQHAKDILGDLCMRDDVPIDQAAPACIRAGAFYEYVIEEGEVTNIPQDGGADIEKAKVFYQQGCDLKGYYEDSACSDISRLE